MNKAAAKNDIQVVLQEYIGNRKAMKVAEAVYAVMQKETQHEHKGKKFFVNEDETGALVLTVGLSNICHTYLISLVLKYLI